MSNLWVQESYVNATEGYRYGDGEPYETYTESLQKLFRDMQHEYGRCVGRMHRDGVGPVGWVFHGRAKYEDSNEPYIRETWVEVFSEAPTLVPRHYSGGKHPWEEER